MMQFCTAADGKCQWSSVPAGAAIAETRHGINAFIEAMKAWRR